MLPIQLLLREVLPILFLFREEPLRGHHELILASAEDVTNRGKVNNENEGRVFTLSNQSRLQFPTSGHSP
jgi:hypothetical protein